MPFHAAKAVTSTFVFWQDQFSFALETIRHLFTQAIKVCQSVFQGDQIEPSSLYGAAAGSGHMFVNTHHPILSVKKTDGWGIHLPQ